MDYSEPVRKYFEAPRRAGDLAGKAGFCIAGSAGRESEGLRIWLAARIEAGRVAEACFRAYGCPYTIAVADFSAGGLEGKQLGELGIEPLAVASELGLPDEKLNCALCAEDAINDLKANWKALG